MGDLTKHGDRVRQRIYDFLVDFFMQNGYAPSVREITAGVGLKSPSSTFSHLLVLEEEGKIKMKGNTTRAIRLVGYKFVKEEQETSTHEETEESKNEHTDGMEKNSDQE